MCKRCTSNVKLLYEAYNNKALENQFQEHGFVN